MIDDSYFPVIIVTKHGVLMIDTPNKLPANDQTYIVVKTNAQALHRVLAERTFNAALKFMAEEVGKLNKEIDHLRMDLDLVR